MTMIIKNRTTHTIMTMKMINKINNKHDNNNNDHNNDSHDTDY